MMCCSLSREEIERSFHLSFINFCEGPGSGIPDMISQFLPGFSWEISSGRGAAAGILLSHPVHIVRHIKGYRLLIDADL
jgi:hypothetical protein